MPITFPDLQAAYDWLNGQINYERNLGAVQYDARTFELEGFRARLVALGDPQRGLRTVHIAGSRGKGSAALALDALLRASGVSTARFTSPHLHEYRERVALNGAMISAEQFMRLLECVANAAEAPRGMEHPAPFKTVFEHLTALFFLAARAAQIDWAIVETGLGGRLDTTNVLDPGPVLLTRIALEHTHLLGDTPEKIAAEKVAILKARGWGVAGEQGYTVARGVFTAYADALEPPAPLLWAEQLVPIKEVHAPPHGLRIDFIFEGQPLNVELPIFGVFQAQNLQNALAVVGELRRRGLIPSVPVEALGGALESVRFPGRMELINSAPEVFVDGAHCPAGAAALAAALDRHFGTRVVPGRRAVAVVAMLADKDHDGFFRELAAWRGWDELWLYAVDSPRATEPEALAKAAALYFSNIRVFPDFVNVQAALLQSAGEFAEKSRRVVVTGSLHGLGAWRDWGLGYNGPTVSIPRTAQAEQVSSP